MAAKFRQGNVIIFNKIPYYIKDVVDNGVGGKEYEVLDFSIEPPRSGLLSAEKVDGEADQLIKGGKRKRTRRRSRSKKSKRRVQKRKSFKKRY
jgi:hypothetical protein